MVISLVQEENSVKMTMMITDKIENAIVKFLNNQASAPEMDLLESWLEDTENEKLFLEYVRVNYFIDLAVATFDKTKLLDEVSAVIRADKKKSSRFNPKKLLRYAAVFLILLSSFGVYKFFFASQITQDVSQIAMNEVVLKSENGMVTVLYPNGTSQIKNRAGEVLFKKMDNTLVYNENQETNALVYNTLTVPYGRRFSLELSDGTKLQVNAGTSIRFPVKFIKGQERKVFVEYGEAFFDVAKDSKHPFIVNNNNIDIKVLGTQFNVSAYPEDKTTTTVLVEGSVQLFDNSKSKSGTFIKPGYQAIWSPVKQNFEVKQADIESQTGWRSGKIVLRSLPFNQMIIKLQRHYNVDIVCNENQLKNEIITATFDEEGIEDVLKLINEIHPIKYEIKGRKITIENNKSK